MTSTGPVVPETGYLVEEIGDQLFWVTDGLYQAMFLVTGEGVVVVDAPPTIGNNIVRAIRGVTTRPVTHGVYSHHHADHAGAMVLFEGAELWAHNDTARLLARDNDRNRPLPTRTFTDSTRLELGDRVLALEYHGPNHCPGNIYVHAPAHQVLMLVDVVYPGWVPFAYLAVSQDIPGWLGAADRALSYPFETFVGGHLTRLGTREDLATHQAYLADLERECSAALASYDVNRVLAEADPSDPWDIFRAYLDGVANQAAAKVAASWRSRLGGVDAFTDVNAWAMVESLRIDAGHLGPFGIRD